jgi:hypothetical protein
MRSSSCVTRTSTTTTLFEAVAIRVEFSPEIEQAYRLVGAHSLHSKALPIQGFANAFHPAGEGVKLAGRACLPSHAANHRASYR